MDDEDCGYHASTKSSRNVQNVYEPTINDLPREVIEIIFERLDSFNRKKIERVCKRWMEIIRGVRKFRTHLLIELPLESVQYAPRDRQLSYYDEVFAKLGHLVKPELEVLHFKSRELPVFTSPQFVEFNRLLERNSIVIELWLMKFTGVDLSMVSLVFTHFTVECSELPGFAAPERRKIQIIRSNITAIYWFECSSLYFEELWLETPDKLPEQMTKLFLAENGPLTEAHSNVLREFERRFTIEAEPDMQRMNSFVHRIRHHFFRRGMRFMDGYNWIEALMTIANGGHVSKHLAVLLQTYFKPTDFPY